MANRQVFPSSLFPLRGDISAEAGSTTVIVQGLQGIPVIAPPVEPAGLDTLFYDSYNNDWYYASPWDIPVGIPLVWEGYGYGSSGISWIAPDTLAFGNGTDGDVSGAAAMTALILFGSNSYYGPYSEYDAAYGPAYDEYHTAIFSGAEQNWSLILPPNPGVTGQVLTTNGTGVTSWTTVSGEGGSSVNINGSPVSNPNFNGTTPAAPTNTVNVAWQVDGSGNVSANVPVLVPNKTLYVDNTRTDSFTPNGTIAFPFPTITDAINQVIANGDNATYTYLIDIHPSVYAETINIGNTKLYKIMFEGHGGAGAAFASTGQPMPGAIVHPASGNAVQGTSNVDQITTLQFSGLTFIGPVDITDSAGNLGVDGFAFVNCCFQGNVTITGTSGYVTVQFVSSSITSAYTLTLTYCYGNWINSDMNYGTANFTNSLFEMVSWAFNPQFLNIGSGSQLTCQDGINIGAQTVTVESGGFLTLIDAIIIANLVINSGGTFTNYQGTVEGTITNNGTYNFAGLGTRFGADIINAGTGFQVNSAAASGQYLRGNGTNFVSSAIQAGDLPAGYAPGGSTGDIQYNNSGAFGGSASTITAGGTITLPTTQAIIWGTDTSISRISGGLVAIGSGSVGSETGGIILNTINLGDEFYDNTDYAGANGWLLSSTGTKTLWINPATSLAVPGSTGDILYNNGGVMGAALATITAAGSIDLPEGQVIKWTGAAYSGVGLSILAADTLAVGNGSDSDVSGAMAMTGLILFGSSYYSAYDAFHTTIYSGATQNWNLVLPETAGTNGQVLTNIGSGFTEWESLSAIGVPWSSLTSATANLTLSNAGFTTTFNQTSAVAWLWANTTAGTSGTTNASPLLEFGANYYTGATSAQDLWTVGSSLAAGTNGVSTLTFAHSGSSGSAIVSVPNLYINNGTANTALLMYGGSNVACFEFLASSLTGTGNNQTITVLRTLTGLLINSSNIGNNASAAVVIQESTANATAFAGGQHMGCLDITGASFSPASGSVPIYGIDLSFTVAQTSSATGPWTGLRMAVTDGGLGTPNYFINCLGGASAATQEFAVTNGGAVIQNGLTTTYNGVTTTKNGIPVILATSFLTAQTSAISAQSIVSSASAYAKGMWRISFVATQTTAGSAGTVLGGTTGFTITFTNANGDTVSKTTALSAPATGIGTSTSDTISGDFYGYAGASTNITYSFGYTAGSVTGGAFDIAVYAEYLG